MTETGANEQDRRPIASPPADEVAPVAEGVADEPLAGGSVDADAIPPEPEITVGMGTVAGLGCVGFIVVMVIILAVIFYGPHLR